MLLVPFDTTNSPPQLILSDPLYKALVPDAYLS